MFAVYSYYGPPDVNSGQLGSTRYTTRESRYFRGAASPSISIHPEELTRRWAQQTRNIMGTSLISPSWSAYIWRFGDVLRMFSVSCKIKPSVCPQYVPSRSLLHSKMIFSLFVYEYLLIFSSRTGFLYLSCKSMIYNIYCKFIFITGLTNLSQFLCTYICN